MEKGIHDQEQADSRTTALYVVATPLGNLADITLRALDVLRGVALIAAEDTRHTRGLLEHHGVRAELIALHEHNESQGAQRIVAELRSGRSVALVTDAGTPAISDPGARVVAAVQQAGLRVVPIPGPSAAVAALSVSGLGDEHFLFHGFLPTRQAARRKTIEVLRPLECALVFYEAPHRIEEMVADLVECLEPEREVVLARELTKLFETVVRLPLGAAPAWLEEDPNRRRGEFVIVVSGPPPASGLSVDAQRTLDLLLQELPLKQAVKLAAQISGAPRNELYRRALETTQQEQD